MNWAGIIICTRFVKSAEVFRLARGLGEPPARFTFQTYLIVFHNTTEFERFPR